jgi:hypothetical protein
VARLRLRIWQNSIQNRDAAGTARWRSTVFTVGGGYIWRFAQDWFIDPWLGGHVVLNPETASLGRFEYKPSVIQGEVSLKVGWILPI